MTGWIAPKMGAAVGPGLQRGRGEVALLIGSHTRGGVTLLLASVSLAGCGYGASRSAHQAQFSMVGMSSNDLQECAGPPDKIVQLNPKTQIFAYSVKPGVQGGLGLPIPLLGTVTLGGSGGTCLANMRVVDNRVTEVHYTGDDDKPIGADGICEVIIRGCVRNPEPTERPTTGPDSGSISAFHSPPVPPQPSGAEYTAPPAAKK